MFKNLGIVPHKNDNIVLWSIAFVLDAIVGFLHRTVGFQLQLGAVGIGTNNATTAVQGAKKITNIGSTRKVPQFPIKEIDINANVAPMSMLIEKLGRHHIVRQDVYNWVERDALPRTLTTAATQVTSGSFDIQAATTRVDAAAGTGAGIVAGTILLCERTGELLRVTLRTTDNLTVTRGFAGTSAQIIAASSAVEELRIVGSAFAENSDAPEGVSVEPAIKTAYPQTVRKAIAASRREINSENFGELEEWKRMSQDAISDIAHQREVACLFNPLANTSDPTSTKGAIGYIASTVVAQSGALDESSLDTFTKKVVRRNNSNRKALYAFCGENIVSAMNGFSRDYLRLTQDDTKLGLDVSVWRSAFGELKLINHPEFGPLNTSVTAANAGPIGMMMMINVSLCGLVHFKGGDLFLDEHVETNGVDGRKDCWTEDFGFFMQNEGAHGIMTGVTG